MVWEKTAELPAAALIQMLTEGTSFNDARIIWQAKDPNNNVIFLATEQNLIDMINDTTEPDDIFEIWHEIKENDLKL